MFKNRFNLAKIIYNDLYDHGQIPLLLLLIITISAISIIWITYQTRYMIHNHEEIILKKYVLEREWNNLIYEKSKITNRNRIETIAIDKLHMIYADPILIDQ